ncbi:MAG: adenosine kinase [Ekhidna sp.]|nr:adenosine kinase [Ekhidna sp.]
MSKKYDVCAIGNAIVDYEIEVTDNFFDENGIEKGLMTLVDEERQRTVLGAAKEKIRKKQGGGSAANTIVGMSALGGKGFYTCKVADDEDGAFYIDELNKAGVDTNLNPNNLFRGITGKCLVMITPDAERTMNTYLGVTSDLSVDDLVPEVIKNSNYVYLEGALVSSETGYQVALEAKKIARESGVKTSLTFWDPAMVKYFNDRMKEIVGGGIDLLFCNIEEAKLYTGGSGLEDVKKALKGIAKEFAVTLGAEGSLVYDGSEFIEIAPFPAKAVDTTGAGDIFAGAFLYGINNGLSHAEAGKLASAASSAIVSKYGPRLEDGQAKEILGKI